MVLVSARAARMLLATWDRAVLPALRRSGENIPDDLAAVIEGCRAITGVPVGTPGTAPEVEDANLREMTTSEVAAVLACSPRNVRGLRSRGRLLARRHPHKGWLFDPVDVAAYIERRAESA